MLEIEVKYRAGDRASLVAGLLELGAQFVEERTECDLYLQSPTRDLKQTDEAFRLRQVGVKNFLTYKGPKRDSETKTRTEIEVPLGEGEAVANNTKQLLAALGFRPVTTVRKQRRVYRFQHHGFDIEACFDRIEELGEFIELEILADEAQYEAAKEMLLTLANDLGLTAQERRSYLGMVLEASTTAAADNRIPSSSS